MKKARRYFDVIKWIASCIIAVVLLFNVAGIVKRVFLREQLPMLFGFGNAIIVTGSMEPTLAPGDMIIIRRQSGYEVGDIVTYQANSCITHRIVAATADGYVTRGDANNADDGVVRPEQIIGKVVKVIPRIGNAILFLHTPFGILLLVVSLLVSVEAPMIWNNRRKRRYR